MDITFEGGNCIVITTKKARIVVDDNLKSIGGKSVSKKADLALYTHSQIKEQASPLEDEVFVIDGPGEYELKEVSIHGIPIRSHMDEEGTKSATMLRLAIQGTMILVTGHIYPELSEDLLEEVGMIDILVVPVGGNGYTLDGVGATKVVKKIDPKIVIPTHYAQRGINFEVPQAEIEAFLKELSAPKHEKVDKLKVKAGIIPDTLTVMEISNE